MALVKNAVDRDVVIMRFMLMQGEPKGLSEKEHINPESSCCGNTEMKRTQKTKWPPKK